MAFRFLILIFHAWRCLLIQPNVTTLPLKDIGLHSSIPSSTKAAWSSILYRATGRNIFTAGGLKFLLGLNPLHVVEEKLKGKSIYGCFAGLRSVQLAKTHLDPDERVRVVVHDSSYFQSCKIADDLVCLMDLYCSCLVFGLDFQTWPVFSELAYAPQYLSPSFCKELTGDDYDIQNKSFEIPQIGRFAFKEVSLDSISCPPHFDSKWQEQSNHIMNALGLTHLGVNLLSSYHPLHLIKNHETSKYICFSGMRILHILKQRKSDGLEKVAVYVHGENTRQHWSEISQLSLSLTPLFHGLGQKVWQYDLLRLWHLVKGHMKHKKLAVGLSSQKSLAQNLKINRITLPRQVRPPESILKQRILL